MSTEQTRPLMTRIPPEMVPRIDAARGEVKRERWVRERLDEVLTGLGFPPVEPEAEKRG